MEKYFLYYYLIGKTYQDKDSPEMIECTPTIKRPTIDEFLCAMSNGIYLLRKKYPGREFIITGIFNSKYTMPCAD